MSLPKSCLHRACSWRDQHACLFAYLRGVLTLLLCWFMCGLRFSDQGLLKSHDALYDKYCCVLHIAQDKYGKSFEDCDSKERQSVGGTKVCLLPFHDLWLYTTKIATLSKNRSLASV